jgi:transposase
VHITGVKDIGMIQQQSRQDIFNVGENFKRQLIHLFTDQMVDSDPVILERINKAANWFQEKFVSIFAELNQNIVVETDNTELGKKITRALNNFKQETAVKLAGIKSCEKNFSPTRYLRAVTAAELDFKPEKVKKHQSPEYNESDVGHPELFQTIKEWRAAKAKEYEVAHFQILHQNVLIQIAIYLPDSINELKKIKGVGKVTAAKYGNELVAMVKDYRQQHKITEVVLPEPPKLTETNKPAKGRTPPANTKQISLTMFTSGLSVSEIAKERGLANSTIEGHLTSFVGTGELDVNQLISPKKQKVIAEKIAEMQGHSLTEIKNSLGDDYSFGELKIMLAHLKTTLKK